MSRIQFSKEDRIRRRNARRVFYEDVQYNLRNSSNKRKLAAFGKLLILLLILIGIPVLLIVVAKDKLLNAEYLSNLPTMLSAYPKTAFVILLLLQTLQIVVCVLPGQPIQLASSYLYGVGGGYVIAIVGATIGCILTYRIANFLGSDAIHLVFGEKRVQDYMKKLNSGKALTIVFLIYLIPGIPKDLVSYVAGISDINLKSFLIVSTLGRSPGILESLLIGSFWADKNYLGVGIVVVITLAILFVCFKMRTRIMNLIDSYEDEEAEAK